MVKRLTQIESISSSELLEEFTKIRAEIKLLLKSHHSEQSDRLITRKETAEILGVSISTLTNWRKSGIIPTYRLGNKIRYKYSEIMASLVKINPEYEL